MVTLSVSVESLDSIDEVEFSPWEMPLLGFAKPLGYELGLS